MKILLVSVFVLTAGMVAAQTTTVSEDTTLGKSASGKGVAVSGKVTDAATRKAAVNVRVGVENFSAAITDADGNFVLNVPSYQATVFISGEGYDTKLVALQGRKTLEVSLLDASHESFAEPVTMPFGIQSKRNVAASVGQYNVNGWQQSTAMPDAILQGRVAGLNAIRRSGVQGAGANLFLRGYNSLYGTNKPLIVVDNMIFDANDYGQSIIANNYTNPLSLIDVRDIDNITVLRDAASIYGAKGANGAIIITTSRAQDQATKIDFGAYAGFNAAPKRLPVMNAADYRTYLSDMLASKGLSSTEIAALPYMNDDPSSPAYHSYHYDTDWQGRVMDNSMSNNYYLKVTGGDNIATYGLSMGYMKNEGIMRGTDLSRYSTRFNAVFNFTRKFTGFANLSFTYNEQNLKDQGIADKTAPLYLSLVKSPFMHDREVNSEGVESPNLAGVDSLGISNPTAVIDKMQAYNKYYRFYGTFGFKYDISEHWNAATTIGIVYDKVRENIFVPGAGLAKDTLPQAIAENRLGTQVKRLYSIYNDTRLEFAKTYNNRHNIAVRAGLRYQKNDAEQDYALGFNSATDELVSVQNGLAALRMTGGGIGKWNWLNTYLNADYGLMDKYFLSFNMAVDGSSRFGKQAEDGIRINGSKFPVMPSLAAAWLISGEDFMAGSGMDLLKLRASYSITANDDIGNYTSRQTYGSQNLLGMQGLVRNGIANPALQWETSRKLNGGLDLAFLNERISIGLDVYSSKTTNMLVYEELPAASGFKTMLTNEGSMQNTGWEATVNARIVNAPKVKWDFGLNVSSYKNKILSVPGGRFTTEYAGATILTTNDQPANQFYGYVTNGVYASDAEAAADGLVKKNADGSFSAFKGGDVRFLDLNEDGEINADDRRVIGNPNPDWTGGITNRLIWNRFELNALITFSQGNDVYNYQRYRLESASGVENQLESLNNRWRADGQLTNTPKAVWGDPMGNSRFSDRWIEDGAYLRLRTISLQYYIPIKNAVLKNATIYATGHNLITLTKYKGYDPEFSATGSVFAQGIDTGLDPLFKSLTLGLRIGL